MKLNLDPTLDGRWPNAGVTPFLPPLEVLRSEIDDIDDQILSLLEQRYAIVRRVSLAKANDAPATLPLRPWRERQIVERLSARANHVPTQDVTHIWRSILSLSAQYQRSYRVTLWAPDTARVALARLAAARFGTAVPLAWAVSAEQAIAAAQNGDSIVLIPADQMQPSQAPELDLIGQYPLDCPDHPWALAMGRIAPEAKAPVTDWRPASWKQRVHHQLPVYRDSPLLAIVEGQLARSEPVVCAEAMAALAAELVEAQQGRRLLIQAGECAEPIDGARSDTIAMSELVNQLADGLERGTGSQIIRVGRIAGQFAKPRSASVEQSGGERLAVYRGDAVNQPGASAAARTADPRRLNDAYAQSRRVSEWLAEQAADAGTGHRALFTSHEALLLNYEAALTRLSAQDGRWWAGSAHSLWLGDRTRDPLGAHVEYLSGIANPVGIKCGPSIDADELMTLLDRIDAGRTPGRIMLVARIGHERVAERLGRLMEAVRDAGHPALWLCDPMHGNNRSIDGVKTRLVPDLVAEVEQFVAVARSAGVHPGGLHLEITPEPVLECVDNLAHAHPERRYGSRCDPRLNPEQAMHIVDRFAAALGAGR